MSTNDIKYEKFEDIVEKETNSITGSEVKIDIDNIDNRAPKTPNTDPPKPQNDDPELNKLIPIRIKIMGGADINIGVSESWNVGDLKERAFMESIRRGKNIRLIYQGKIMEDPQLLSEFKLKPNAYIHSAINITGAPGDVENNNNMGAGGAGSGRGFDALQERGYNQLAIFSLRLEFHNMMIENGREDGSESPHQLLRNEEDYILTNLINEDMAMAHEVEQEVPALYPPPSNDRELPDYAVAMSRRRASESGTIVDLIAGILLGSLIPLIALFCFWIVPLNRRFKLGILIGVVIYFTVLAFGASH